MESKLGVNETGSGENISRVLINSSEKAVDALDMAIDLLEDLQTRISAGVPKTVRLKLGEKVVAEFPVALTAAAALAVGLAAVIVSKLTIEIIHE